MTSYLDINYSREEYSESSYPQKLCNYIYERFFKNNIIKNYECKLLDIGSGRGNHLVGFSRKGISCYGLDKRKECIEVLNDFTIKECDIETEAFPYEDNMFDFIFSKSVIEHVRNADNFVLETKRVLKKGGIAIIMCPDWGTQYQHYWDDYTHVQPWTRKSLQNCMRINGFEEVSCELFRQIPLLWKYPFLNIISYIVSFLPQRFKWRDSKEEQFNTFVRFSKEKMLLCRATK